MVIIPIVKVKSIVYRVTCPNIYMSTNCALFSFSPSHVVKFLRKGDPKYKYFFVRRMQQLADGQRSRILAKRLKGSQSTIYETYLEVSNEYYVMYLQVYCLI